MHEQLQEPVIGSENKSEGNYEETVVNLSKREFANNKSFASIADVLSSAQQQQRKI
jgi:hypothetical protein